MVLLYVVVVLQGIIHNSVFAHRWAQPETDLKEGGKGHFS